MIAVIKNLYTKGTELKDLNGLDYIGYFHINNSGSIMSESDYVAGVSKQLILSAAVPENSIGDLLSRYNEETESYDGLYTIIPVKNYKNDIDLPGETILLEDPAPVTITDQPDVFFKRVVDDIDNPGLEVFIDESNVIRVVKGTSITLQFGYESADAPSNIKFEWFDSFDRVISTEPVLVVDTNTITAEEEIYYCTITDSFGSDTTNEITINIVNPADNQFIFKNIIQNGYANDGTSNWDSVGETPEDTGKFLPEFETVEVPDYIFGLNAGTYFYHKFIAGPDGKQNKNQWYPRPEDFDVKNNFRGTIIQELKDNYFRAGSFSPVVRDGDNDHKGTTKSSTQIIDLTDFGAGLDGKIYGIKGFYAVMFGWLGGRADQGDRVTCEIEFLNENDEVIPTTGNNIIENATWYDRVANEYLLQGAGAKTARLHAGYKEKIAEYDTKVPFAYTGIFKDGNNGIDFERYESVKVLSDGSERIVTPIVKTVILGRTTDMLEVPPATRKIRVIKTYYHVPGVVDLIWEGKQWQEEGNEYISDALVAGLNVRLYPVLINTETGEEDYTGFDNNGNSVIQLMDFLEQTASLADIASVAAVNGQDNTQYYDGQELMFDSNSPALILNSSPYQSIYRFASDESVPGVGNDAFDKIKDAPTFGSGYVVACNDALKEFLSNAAFDSLNVADVSLYNTAGKINSLIISSSKGDMRPVLAHPGGNTTTTTYTIPYNNTSSAGRVSFNDYRRIINDLTYWKYSLLISYRDIAFKFKNTGLGTNGAAKLTVTGLVPIDNSSTPKLREYDIYTEIRAVGIEKWEVRVPFILNDNYWNPLPSTLSGYNIYTGLGYRPIAPTGTGFRSDGYIPLPDNRFTRFTVTGQKVEFPAGDWYIIPLNPSKILLDNIGNILQAYGEHPGLYYYQPNPTVNQDTRRSYGLVPVGVEAYRVKLELANGEGVSRYFNVDWQPIQGPPTPLPPAVPF